MPSVQLLSEARPADTGAGLRTSGRRVAAMLCAIVAVALAAPVAAAAAPACTNPIASCPCQISAAGGSYVISPGAQNLVTTGAGDCIRIWAPHVTLDLGSAKITSSVPPSDSAGIHVFSGAADAVVEGAADAPAVIQHFGTGIQIDAHGVTLKNLTAQSNGIGILLDGAAAYGNALNVLDSTRVGILIRGPGTGPFLDGVSVSDTIGPGVKLNGVQGAFLVNLTVTANDTYGVWLRGSSRNVIADFTASQNTIAGVYLGCFSSGGSLNRACDANPPVAPSNGNVVAGLANPSSVDGPIQPNQEYGVVIGNGNTRNRVVDVEGSGNGTGASGADAADYNPDCGGNVWRDNDFATTIPAGPDGCIH
jgi:parallel beta-helix repeat protein